MENLEHYEEQSSSDQISVFNIMKNIIKSGAMVFIFNLDKISLKKLFPTMNI